MIREDKELLLKDLSARLPYVVKIKCNDDTEPYTLLSINWNKEIVLIGFEIDGIYVTSKQKLADIKPYLRPMSSMTEEEKETYHNLCYEEEREEYEFGEWVTRVYYHDTIYSVDYLNSIHVDYRGLIPKGLTIAVTESNNPYKD